MNIKEILSFNSPSSELSLTPEDRQFLEKIARKIHQHGLVTRGTLEMSKPLSLLGSHFLVFFGPIINAFIRSGKLLSNGGSV